MSRLAWACTAFLLPFLANGRVEASTSATVCNRSSAGMWIGVGYFVDEKVKFMTSGWQWADRDRCTAPVELRNDRGDVYVYANTADDDIEWSGNKQLCVSMDGDFDFEQADSQPCAFKRSFRPFPRGADGNVMVELLDEQSVRVAYSLTVCNKTQEETSVALGHEPDSAEGISSDGWYSINPGACTTFVRRGKIENAYLYAQSRTRDRVWHGDRSICARDHSGFVFDDADSMQCNAEDSERLPFLKTALANGRRSYDLTEGNAQVFRDRLILCNRYRDDIYPSIARLDPILPNGIVARGYWHLRPGECKAVDAVSTGPVFVHAETLDGQKDWSGEDLVACLRPKAFVLPAGDRYACRAAGERLAGFVKWSVHDGENVWKFE